MNPLEVLPRELHLSEQQVGQTLRLLDEQSTVPFIARYRKEQTGGLDEVQIRQVRDRAAYLRELEARRATVLESIAAQGALSEALRRRIEAAQTKQALEDLYLPWRPKRRTRAQAAREKGLEPLARRLFGEALDEAQVARAVAEFLAAYPGAHDGAEMGEAEAWAGCRDIRAEEVAEDAPTRGHVRELTAAEGRIAAAATPEYAGRRTKFSDYYAHSEPLARIPPHRYLALRRGEKERVLRLRLEAPEAEILAYLEGRWLQGRCETVRAAERGVLADAYRRLIAPAVEAELRVRLKEQADAASIGIFAANLRNLLLAPPGGARVVLGLDPGLRTGCKWVVVDATGRLLDHGTVYPLAPRNDTAGAGRVLREAVARHGAEVLAVGNGTGSRELMAFVRERVRADGLAAVPVTVSEAGASVYSASPLAREELPDHDVTVRGAVSIARRFQDPLAELVKIDPKAIGVGQYQHDVNQARLRAALDETVESCVNHVGVHLNTASAALLRYVSGIGPALARAIVGWREAHGAIASRESLSRIPGLGPKSFEQCAGFLRIAGGDHPLDDSAVHPERYAVVERMAADLSVPLAGLVGNETLLARIEPRRYVDDSVGLPTLTDILDELRKPGRDPREPRETVHFDERVGSLDDLRPGMRLPGVVTNLTHFGAFVDVGVHTDGLVHVSELADRFVRDPAAVVRVGQPVHVAVLDVDRERGRVALSMRSQPGAPRRKPPGRRQGRGGKPQRGGEARPAAESGPLSEEAFEQALHRLSDKFRR